MGYAQESGYTPSSITTLMDSVMTNVNTQFGTSYTTDTFIGSNFYKFFYALIQKLQENEVKTSEIFVYLQQYFAITNEKISRPVVTNPGLISALGVANYVASVKPMISADAGKINICVDTDDGVHATGTITITDFGNLTIGSVYDSILIGVTSFVAQSGSATLGDATFQAATDNDSTAASLALQINSHATASTIVRAHAIGAVVTLTAIHGGVDGNTIVLTYTDAGSDIGATVSGSGTLASGVDNADYPTTRLAICTIIKDSTIAGAITQGTESETITLSNAQEFDFKFWLPNRLAVLLRLTTTLSLNNQVVISTPDNQKLLLLSNIKARYQLGKNFEPQKYFNLVDAPWASQVLLEYSLDNGTTYSSSVYEANFDELFDISLGVITLVED